VHARKFYAHFDSVDPGLAESGDFAFRLNGKLPADISVQRLIRVRPDAHARFDALSRTYEYHICRQKNVFDREFSHYIYGEMDTRNMQEAALVLKEYTDFTSFSKVDTDVKTNNCRIMDSGWSVSDERLVYRVTADRFLRNMVRAICGTLLEIGFGKMSLDEFREVIESRDRSNAGTSVPAKGLFLTDITYPDSVFI
jgi:tRNA pseudouridine38-40 synthase